MRVGALTAGVGVPQAEFSGCVAEVHASASLVELADGTLLTLLSRELGAQPHGISLDVPTGFSFQPMLLRGGALAARAGVLRISESALVVDLRGVRPWRSNLEAILVDFRKTTVQEAWRVAWVMLKADGRSEQLVRLAGIRIAALEAATRRADARAARHAMGGLIGLGPGRTPAGDDFLVGYLAGLKISATGGPNDPFVPTLLSNLKELNLRTNRLSRLYLDDAADGEISERLRDVAMAIAAGAASAGVRRALAAALAVGHCSGAAAVLGLLRGSAAGSEVQSEADAAPSGKASTTLPACSPRSANPKQITPSSR
ncbi:MAG: DUF2877 domain-containing protein [Acetobacteraceae bacterium]